MSIGKDRKSPCLKSQRANVSRCWSISLGWIEQEVLLCFSAEGIYVIHILFSGFGALLREALAGDCSQLKYEENVKLVVYVAASNRKPGNLKQNRTNLTSIMAVQQTQHRGTGLYLLIIGKRY